MIKQNSVFHTFLILAVSLAIILGLPQSAAAVLIPVTGYDVPTLEENTLPSLQDFTIGLSRGASGQLVGVYAENAFAYAVVQQPAGEPAFVSNDADVLTEFSLASQYGSTGLLAHNYLAGASFDQLEESQQVALVYGDGSLQNYTITEVREFQAISPYSPYSNFRDLDNQKVLTSTDLFMQTYALEGVLVLQTCLERNGVDSWGRIFVIAQPAENSILDL